MAAEFLDVLDDEWEELDGLDSERQELVTVAAKETFLEATGRKVDSFISFYCHDISRWSLVRRRDSY